MKKIILISSLLIICGNLSSQDRFLEVIKNISCIERKINQCDIIDLSNAELDLSGINQDFTYEDQAYILLNSTDKYSLYCPFPFKYVESTGKSELKGFSMKYMFVDKAQRRCFEIKYMEQTEGLNKLGNDYYTACNLNLTVSINSIRELDFNNLHNPKMILDFIQSTYVDVDFPKIGDFNNMVIYSDCIDNIKWIHLSEDNTYKYNIYNITYDDFMGLYEKFDELLNISPQSEK